MARPVLPTLDFRTQAERQGITKTQQTVQSIANILKIVGRAEKARQDTQTLDRVARALSTGTIEDISTAANQRPSFGGGFQGVLQKIGGAFQPEGGMRESIIQSIIGMKLQQALATKSLRPIATGPVTSVFDPATGQITPTEHPSPRVPTTTITTGQKLLTEEDRLARAKAEQDKIMGRAGPGLSPSDKKALGEEMDQHLDKARRGFFTRPGRTNYPDAALFKQWKDFNAANTFDNDNQRDNAWAIWQSKVNKRGKEGWFGKEVGWDPTDPKWREAIGLEAEGTSGEGIDLGTLSSESANDARKRINTILMSLPPKRKGPFMTAWAEASKSGKTDIVFLAEWLKGQKEYKSQYKVGDTVPKGGRKYKIIGFDTDGEPLVEPIQ